MEEMFTYTNIFIATLALVWLLLIISKPEVRREMITLGVLALFLLPMTFVLGEADPSKVQASLGAIGLRELILSVSLAGIAAVIFHAVTGQHYHKLPRVKRKRLRKKDSHAQHWFLRIFLLLLVFVWIILLFNLLFDVTLASSALIAAVMICIYVVSHRHDLLLDAVWSGLLTSLIVAFAATLAESVAGGILELPFVETSGSIGNIPIDLLVWSLAVGLLIGPIYEFVRRLEIDS